MTKSEVLTWIRRAKVVPVIRAPSSELALEAVDALVEGGIDVLEITMTVPGAVEVIAEACRRLRSKALVGAGTVMDAATAEACVAAGARFIVSPAFDISTVHACNRMEVVISPGALTPTEIVTAWRAGADVVKVFPCGAMGGPSYIRYLKAPLPDIPLMPTGGPTLESLGEYLAAGALAVGIAGSLVDIELLQDGRREEFVARARAIALAVRG